MERFIELNHIGCSSRHFQHQMCLRVFLLMAIREFQENLTSLEHMDNGLFVFEICGGSAMSGAKSLAFSVLTTFSVHYPLPLSSLSLSLKFAAATLYLLLVTRNQRNIGVK